MGLGDVCPTTGGLLAFAAADGKIARMAVVRPANAPASAPAASTIGRYVVGPKFAAGGMASVHLGRLRSSAGFSRTVAIKRLLPDLAKDPEFVTRFCDEARIASRIRHTNVVPTLDVVHEPEVLLVLEYVHGESLWRLLRTASTRDERCPPAVASAIVVGVLRGLHVAHQAKGENGLPLDLVHRDVSPQNVLVGADGVPRVLDFGIAKAAGREMSTISKGSSNDIRGKLAYMAPEQVAGEPIDRRADVFAAGVMLWESLASERLFKGEDAMQTMEAVFHRDPPPLSNVVPGVSPRVDEVLAMALSKDPEQRYLTADEMARAIEIALPPASDREVAEWVDKIGAESLSARSAVLARFERSTEGDDDDDRDNPHDPTTLKRSAVFPPALPGAVPPKMRDSAATIPAFDPEKVVKLPSVEPIRTPFSMVTPAVDPLARSGMTETRVGPIDFDSKRRPQPVVLPHTPMPSQTPMREPNARSSAGKIAALVLLPPLAAAIMLFVVRPAPIAKLYAPAVAAQAVDPPMPIPPPTAAAPPLAATIIEPSSTAPTPAISSTPTPTPTAARVKSPRVSSPRIPRHR
jgi:eukaryotic-like serine/threonine-protein kinase